LILVNEKLPTISGAREDKKLRKGVFFVEIKGRNFFLF